MIMKTNPSETCQDASCGLRRAVAFILKLLLISFVFGLSWPGSASGTPVEAAIEWHAGQPRLKWPSAAGRNFHVEAGSDLTPGSCTRVATVNAKGTTAMWTDANPGTRRFYRVVEEVPAITAAVAFTHFSVPNGIADLTTASFASVSSRLRQMAASGSVSLPVPVPDLAVFDNLTLAASAIYIDDLKRTVVLSGGTTVRGQPVNLMFTGNWADDTGGASAFSFGLKLPQFQIADWVSGLAGTALDDLTFDGSVLTLATATADLNLSVMPGNVAAFYGTNALKVKPGININRLVNLAEASGLAQTLDVLGFTDMTAKLDGFLGVDPNLLFQASGPVVAPLMNLRAALPAAAPPGFPGWIRPVERVLEFSFDPLLRVRLTDILETTGDGPPARFMAATEIATDGSQTSVALTGALVEPWVKPFGISWLTLNDAVASLTFSNAGPAEVSLNGSFTAGNQTVTTEIILTETGTSHTASFAATVDQITLGDVLHLLADLTGTAPFGNNLPDDALVLSDLRLEFNSSDTHSVTVSATSTILGAVQTDVLFSFVQPETGQPLLILGLHVHDFKLSALYEGIDGSFAGDLEFPGVAFTVAQELPNAPSEPIRIPSGNLGEAELDFFRQIHGPAPFVLEVKAGVNFSGMFAQSRLPTAVQNALGMDPAGKILLEGALGLRLGALTGGGLVAMDSLHLKATLPAPTQPRLGFPEWLGNLQSGPRVLEFLYESPDIEVSITDTFHVQLDGALRTFVTSTTLATNGEQASVTLTGDMTGGWPQPFGVDWLTLNTVGIVITADGATVDAALHSSFQLGSKTIALEMGISGNAASQLVSFSGSVSSLSLSDFIELARNHLGADADPFGDSDIDFTFTDVRMNIEMGARRSFSLGGLTELRGKPARCLFSAIPRPGGGLPQIITGFQMDDWSLADALPELQGTFVSDFEFNTASLIFSKGEGTTRSEDMDPETRSFYGRVYESNGSPGDSFSVPHYNGLGLIGAAPMGNNPLQSGLDAMGASSDSLLMTGTVPGGILGLGGGTGGGLSGLSLVAGLPPIELPEAPDWFIEGQLGLQITAQPSVGLVGSITVNIDNEILTFNVSAEVQRAGAGVEFALTGGLASAEPWINPFGIEWLIFNNATVKVAVSALGSIKLGFAGDMVIGEKDIDVAVAVTLSQGIPTNFIFDGASEAGVSMADLVMLQQSMAASANPIPLSTMPNMEVRRIHLKFAPHSDDDLGVEAGFAIAGDLWIPSEANGPADRNFASIDLSVDFSGIVAQGHLGAFTLGPLTWNDAVCDIVLTLPQQHLFISGAVQAGSFFEGELDVSLTKTGLSFATTTSIYNQFQAQLTASAAFSLDNPDFSVHGLLQNNFGTGIVPDLTQKLKARASASVSVADDMLRRGLTGWTSFRTNPHALNFKSRITGFANAAEWDIDQWEPFINAIQKAMDDIDFASPSTPSSLLDKALNGFTTAGVPGVKTTVLGVQFCNGVIYPGGPCWTVPPRTVGGVCHNLLLTSYNIPCTSGEFINEKLIPPLISRIDNILQNQNRNPMIIVERAEFTAGLNGLAANPSVTLATRIQFMKATTRLNLSSTWNFSNRDASLNALRDALIGAL